MKRGEIWTAASGEAYAGKPRPVLILQDDRFDATASVTVCGLTTDGSDAPLMRPLIEATGLNGLRASSWLMVDKITTVPRRRLGKKVGRLNREETMRVGRAIAVFLGLAG